MTRDDVIRLAREAGFERCDCEPNCHLHYGGAGSLEIFAYLAITDFLARTGQYVTNDASREAALEQARAEEREAWPDLTCVIQWLEAGCDPKDAAKELRLLQDKIRARGQG